ncbi:nucleoside deaminase [Clostridium tagluense]|nr:nucleoside deaminase [Clostridium tagluense]MBU3128693.1 nucleoside deaminase [Clostridium tagluense]MCB2312810.1 nucleoside deaminase [Clostridium tagluense]MCB2317576.1 nucleoside deaminase [Clostridium tagluense]MCB2327337.1 nucleoside deaminase [Clostridium tagluense]MCB2332056.1 nucleoside deaminase [Clostridium tagluense]
MWSDLNIIWKECFSLAWKSFNNNTIPIGAVIVDLQGSIIARGRNRIYDKGSNHTLSGTDMAHAEMTAMSTLKKEEHPEIKSYTLYTTMEPCPMCFGTMVMMGIRNLKYAAKDGFAGATELNTKMDYIHDKSLNIGMEGSELEVFQICLQASYEYLRNHNRIEKILNSWSSYCSDGVDLAKGLYEDGYFKDAICRNKPINDVYDEIINIYKKHL